MTAPDPDKRARDRFAILMGFRAGGGALILLGLWMLLGGSLGGAYGFGAVLMVMGFVGMILVPRILARRWRTPR